MRYLEISAVREGYSPSQCGYTMTVGDLISYMEDFESDMPIYLSHDHGYTYGPVTEGLIGTEYYDDDDSEDEED